MNSLVTDGVPELVLALYQDSASCWQYPRPAVGKPIRLLSEGHSPILFGPSSFRSDMEPDRKGPGQPGGKYVPTSSQTPEVLREPMILTHWLRSRPCLRRPSRAYCRCELRALLPLSPDPAQR